MYELSNHLGNVGVVISDMRIGIDENNSTTADYYLTDVVSATDFMPFGMPMPGRSYTSESYRFGFNGMEKDDEMKGEGNSLDFGARIYDSRLGRWLSLDPNAQNYSSISDYVFVGNMPTWAIDPDGKDIVIIGSAADKRIIMTSLAKLALNSNTGLDLINNAIKSDRTIVIVSSEDNIPNQVTGHGEKNSVMSLNLSNPNKPYIESDGRKVENNLEFTLAHELSHFLSEIMGYLLDDNGYNMDIDPQEVEAIEVENQVRREYGASERNEYSNDKVHGFSKD